MSLIDRITALPSRLSPPSEPIRLIAAAHAVEVAYGDFGRRERAALEVLVERATTALNGWTWEALYEGEIGVLVRAMAARETVLPPALEAFLLAELRATTRPNLLWAFCDGFVAGWTPRDASTATFAGILTERSAWLPRAWQARFAQVPELFDTVGGAENFGRWLAAESAPHRAVIEKGIPAPHGPGFMRHVHGAWLAAQPPATDGTKARRLLAWILPPGVPPLRGDRAAEVVAALLRPWIRTMPPEELRTFLVKTLVDAHGDPRRENPEFWHAVGLEGRRVMLRWIAGRRMEVFLDVVSRAEAVGHHGDQWAPRRRFWMGVYAGGRIEEAWVSFGKDAADIADRLRRETGDIAYAEYGRTGKSRKDTCLLVMRIGSKIIVEGSHSFRVHVFDASNPNAPELYADAYDVDSFLLPQPHDDARVHDTGGNWMSWVRRRIA